MIEWPLPCESEMALPGVGRFNVSFKVTVIVVVAAPSADTVVGPVYVTTTFPILGEPKTSASPQPTTNALQPNAGRMCHRRIGQSFADLGTGGGALPRRSGLSVDSGAKVWSFAYTGKGLRHVTVLQVTGMKCARRAMLRAHLLVSVLRSDVQF